MNIGIFGTMKTVCIIERCPYYGDVSKEILTMPF